MLLLPTLLLSLCGSALGRAIAEPSVQPIPSQDSPSNIARSEYEVDARDTDALDTVPRALEARSVLLRQFPIAKGQTITIHDSGDKFSVIDLYFTWSTPVPRLSTTLERDLDSLGNQVTAKGAKLQLSVPYQGKALSFRFSYHTKDHPADLKPAEWQDIIVSMFRAMAEKGASGLEVTLFAPGRPYLEVELQATGF
ncbi:hypothetical protein F4776DRAFT_561459 [Hypoxylon sp. NC0597]|nr:hypothetical protein F4776DRAFT_561459 [Hypoxylon sp. NC0597]